MKNVFKAFGVVAFAAIIGFSFAALSLTGCGGGDGGNPVMRTVTFDANGGTVEGAATKAVKVEDGKKVTLPGDPVNNPRIFWGWFDNETQPYGNCFTGTTPITADKTVYARWDDTAPPSRFEVTFDANGGTFAGNERTQVIKVYPDEMVTPPYPTKNDGTIVSGWNRQADGTGTAFDKDTPVTASLTVYAQWAKPEDMPDKDRWSVWRDSSSSATLEYSSIDSEGLCTLTVGGAPEKQGVDNVWRAWTVSAEYFYTGIADKMYEYTFEAWTGSVTRDLHAQYYEDNDKAIYLNETVPITTTRTTYTIRGQALPKGGLRKIQFQLADQTGTVHIKMLKIKEYTLSKLTITNFSGNPDMSQNNYIAGAATISDPDHYLGFGVKMNLWEHGFYSSSIQIKGSTIAIPVWEVVYSGQYTFTPYFGNITIAVGDLYLETSNSGGTFIDAYFNTAPIIFTNGNATINFGTQMRKDNSDDNGGNGGNSDNSSQQAPSVRYFGYGAPNVVDWPKIGQTIIVLEPVSYMEEYTFVGWNTAEDGSGITYKPGDSFIFGGGTTIRLFAMWVYTTDEE